MGLPLTRNLTSRRIVVWLVLLVVKYTGFGESVSSPLRMERGDGRNGILATAFCGRGSRKALCTTPVPLPMWCGVLPGNAPQDG